MHQSDVCSQSHYSFVTTCKGCVHMKNIWYHHIEEMGFVDFEKQGSSNGNSNLTSKLAFESNQTYYQWARDILNNAMFQFPIDKIIWEYHSEGFTRRRISEIVGIHHTRITRKIHKIEKQVSKSSTIYA